MRAAIRKQLGDVRRDIGYLEQFRFEGCIPEKKDIPTFLTILKVYEQQKYMYDHKVHSVPGRIVSISQPWLRPIVRGKGKVTAQVEFGAKLDLSLDTEGYGRIKKISFDLYVNNLDAVEPPVRRKVSHLIYTCFCYSYGMRSSISCKACYRTADAARA